MSVQTSLNGFEFACTICLNWHHKMYAKTKVQPIPKSQTTCHSRGSRTYFTCLMSRSHGKQPPWYVGFRKQWNSNSFLFFFFSLNTLQDVLFIIFCIFFSLFFCCDFIDWLYFFYFHFWVFLYNLKPWWTHVSTWIWTI